MNKKEMKNTKTIKMKKSECQKDGEATKTKTCAKVYKNSVAGSLMKNMF